MNKPSVPTSDIPRPQAAFSVMRYQMASHKTRKVLSSPELFEIGSGPPISDPLVIFCHNQADITDAVKIPSGKVITPELRPWEYMMLVTFV